MTTQANPTALLYVDCDGVPFWLIDAAIREVRQRRPDVEVVAYRDWTDPGHHTLFSALEARGVALAHVEPHSRRKNGTDLAIAVDIVHAVHTRRPEFVALVANDGDFTSVARFVTRAGIEFWGYGTTWASPALRQSCTGFVRYDTVTKLPMAGEPCSTPIDELVFQALSARAAADGWLHVTDLAQDVVRRHGLSIRDLGWQTWSKYLRSDHRFEYCAGVSPSGARVRMRPARQSAA